MSILICRRCGYVCDYKYLLKRHLTRKIPCKILIEEISIDELLKELDNEDLEEYSRLKEHDEPTELKEPEKSKVYKCKHCNKSFSQATNMYRHQKTCKESKSEIEVLKDTIATLQKQVANITTSTTNNNTTNNNIQKANNIVNITLNNFGNESYDHITDDFLKKCIMNNVSGVKSLIEKIHFSEEAPENKNVRLRSIKNNLVEISNNAKWVVKDANEAMETMIHKGCKILNGYYNNPQSGLLDEDLNELDTRIQNFLLSIMDKNNKYYFTLRRRILALLIEHSDA